MDYHAPAAGDEAHDVVAGHGVAAVRKAHHKPAHAADRDSRFGNVSALVGQYGRLGDYLFIVVDELEYYLIDAYCAVAHRGEHLLLRGKHQLL